MIGKARTPFEAVRKVTLNQLFFKLKIDHIKDDIERLVTVKSMPALFPDVKETLTRLKDMSRFLMSVFSDGDPQSLNNALIRLGIRSTAPSLRSRLATTSPAPAPKPCQQKMGMAGT